MPWTLPTEQQLQLKWEKLPYKIKAHKTVWSFLHVWYFCHFVRRLIGTDSSRVSLGVACHYVRAVPPAALILTRVIACSAWEPLLIYTAYTHTCRYCSTTNFYHTLTMYHCHSFHWITFRLRFVLILFWHVIKASAVTWEVRYHGDSYLAPP